MNYYFLLEDEKSFIKVLPFWLEYMGFHNKRVADIMEVTKNNYILQSGQGVTQLITRVLYQTIDTLLNNMGKIDELIVVLDSEELDIETRKNQVINRIKEYGVQKQVNFDFSYKVFVCNHCFETWLLGNQNLFPQQEPDKREEFYQYYKYYNIKTNDPELMLPPNNVTETIATYHFHYLHEACRFNHIRYCKKRPTVMTKHEYFEMIVNRIKVTDQLKSFGEFYNYFISL